MKIALANSMSILVPDSLKPLMRLNLSFGAAALKEKINPPSVAEGRIAKIIVGPSMGAMTNASRSLCLPQQ